MITRRWIPIGVMPPDRPLLGKMHAARTAILRGKMHEVRTAILRGKMHAVRTAILRGKMHAVRTATCLRSPDPKLRQPGQLEAKK
jgi:hypothetical protein